MNIEKQLETAIKTNHLVLVVFYADCQPPELFAFAT